VTRPRPSRAGPQSFVLRPQLSVSVLGAAAASVLAGAVLLVLAGSYDWPVLAFVAAGALLVTGLALVTLASLAYWRLRQTLVLDDEVLTVRRGAGERRLRWSDIERVTLHGDRLMLVTRSGAGEPAEVVRPAGSSPRTFTALLTAIRRRLDANRGHGNLE